MQSPTARSMASFSTEQANDLLNTILQSMPTADGNVVDGDRRSSRTALTEQQTSRRLLKKKQQLARQNNFITELKKKIREKETMTPRTNTDREELAFLRSRLAKENELLHRLLREVIQEQQSEGGAAWQSIRLCSDPVDDVCRNPWTLGSTAVREPRFSYDSNLSPLSSEEVVAVGPQDGTGDSALAERFQKELMNRDRVIEILQQRMERLIADIGKVKRDNEAILERQPAVPVAHKFCEADMIQRLEFYKENAAELEKNLEKMDVALRTIRAELGPACKEEYRKSITEFDATPPRPCSTVVNELPRGGKDGEEQQYSLLLQEYTRKSSECRQLTEQLAKAKRPYPDEPAAEETERAVLKARCVELLDEQEEFRVLIQEQSQQLDDYREKYLGAQQTVEEQKLQLGKLNISNKRVEQQINIEIDQIKRKFQDKLRELTPYPRLLEEETAKVDKLKESNTKLFSELEKTLKQVKALEQRLHEQHTTQNTEVQNALSSAKVEVEQLQERLKIVQHAKELVEEELQSARKQLDDLRTESAKIIARNNQRAEDDKATAAERYSKLELQLTKSRAEASMTIANREDALREMHGQIKVLSGSFDDAQMQIRALRNQLAYLQNERLACLP